MPIKVITFLISVVVLHAGCMESKKSNEIEIWLSNKEIKVGILKKTDSIALLLVHQNGMALYRDFKKYDSLNNFLLINSDTFYVTNDSINYFLYSNNVSYKLFRFYGNDTLFKEWHHMQAI